uniref:Uncharacterized protein n=1 Tax=Desulfobacca acetoxidans TaxID=60893 RepID=A0A7C3V6P9_9BACT
MEPEALPCGIETGGSQAGGTGFPPAGTPAPGPGGPGAPPGLPPALPAQALAGHQVQFPGDQ